MTPGMDAGIEADRTNRVVMTILAPWNMMGMRPLRPTE